MATKSESLSIVKSSRTALFDEIEQNFLSVLGRNERFRSEKCGTSIDFPSPENGDFFLPSPEDHSHTEPQLYSVEQGELQPIISPFMVPGIYRKIDTSAGSKGVTQKPCNVYLTESEPHGRIVSVNDFKKYYVCEDMLEDALNNNDLPRRVVPLKGVGICGEEGVNTVAKTTSLEDSLTKKWDVFTRLAYNILKVSSSEHSVVINRSRNEIVRTEKNSKQKTIYKFLDNETLGLTPPPARQVNPKSQIVRKNKLGRPRKRKIQGIDEDVSEQQCKPKNSKQQPEIVNKSNSSKIPTESQSITSCSRFGRVLKPFRGLPLTVAKKSDELNVYDITGEKSDLINDIKDKDFTCNLKSKTISESKQCHPNSQEEGSTSVPLAASSPSKRRVPPESICPTCKKIFLGRRLKRHFVDHPDHMKPDPPKTSNLPPKTPTEELSLFRFLVSKLQKTSLNEDQRADLFLHELNDLAEQLQLRSSRLIRNTFGLHLINARTARILGIPEGQYALDMSAIDTTPDPESSCTINFDGGTLAGPSNNTRSLDYTALSLDDTLTDEAAQKLNLSAGGKLLPPSEESLLRAVDDLVPQTGITKLVVSTNLINQSVGVSTTATSSNSAEAIVPHYDHASDNAVEAVEAMKECNTGEQGQPILDLAVDFFQFNTTK